MIVNNIGDEDKSKLKRVITENTKPDTSNNLAAGNFGFNNLNSILKNVDEDRVVKYLKIPKTETAKIEDNIIKEMTSNDNSKNNDRLCVNNTNIKKNNKQQNIDLFFFPKRVDRFGEPILPRSKGGNGKHKVTFIDRITKNNFSEVIKIESFKEYNKMEEISSNNRNQCLSCTIS
jgi:hypothetical protein